MKGGEQGNEGTREQGGDRGWRWMGPVVVLGAALLAVAPQMVRGCSCGHDFDFHLVSWFDALTSWRHGVVYPQWAPSPNFNAGEPRFVFYPPLTWMLGAALGAVLKWAWVPGALTFMLLAGTGLATRALARMRLPEGAAALAGCVAIFSGYTLYTTYERAAFAELAGGIWFPLMMLVVLREDDGARGWRHVADGSALLLALVVAGAWLSNAPVGVMMCYLLAGFAVVVAVVRRSWWPVVRGTVGGALGLGLAAFYILPAAYERRWVAIQQATDDPGERIENSFLFGHHAGAQMALHDAELHRVSWIAVGMLGAIAVGLGVGWLRGSLPGGRRWWVPLALVPAGVLVLLLPVSLPVWNVLPEMRFLQFPWRWLVVLEAPVGVLVAAAVVGPGLSRSPNARDRGHPTSWVVVCACAVVFVGMAVWAGRSLFQVCDEYDAVPGMLKAYGDGGGFIGTDEYAPPGADNYVVPQSLPAGCLVSDPEVELGKETKDDPQPDWSAEQGSCAVVFDYASGAEWPRMRRRIEGVAPQAGWMVVRVRRFPAWDVRVNGVGVTEMPEREDGLMVVPVAAGPVRVTVDWRTTEDVWLGRWVSLGAVVVLVGLLGMVGVVSGKAG